MIVEPIIADSARRHLIADEDILHAYRHAITIYELEDGLVMLIGGDRAGNPLEVGVVEHDDGPTIVHCMFARPKFL